MEPAARFCKRVISMSGLENIKSPAAEMIHSWHHKSLQQCGRRWMSMPGPTPSRWTPLCTLGLPLFVAPLWESAGVAAKAPVCCSSGAIRAGFHCALCLRDARTMPSSGRT